jgi:spoIIIJ-associated protein
MESIERVGVDVEEAEKLALEQLGLPREKVKIEILEEPKKGLLGVGAKLAKVRATALEAQPLPGKIDLRKKGASGGAMAGGESQGSSHGGSRGGRSGGGREKRSGGERGRRHSHETAKPFEPAVDPRKEPHYEGKEYEFIKNVLERMKLNLELTSMYIAEERTLFFDIEGPDAKYLIGKEGKTLEALQHLMNIVYADDEERNRVLVDVEHYRARRLHKFLDMAQQRAARVLESGRPAAISGMSRFERRAVHEVIQKLDGLSTHSEGEEPQRKLIIEKEE